jgi:hypothetical protein
VVHIALNEFPITIHEKNYFLYMRGKIPVLFTHRDSSATTDGGGKSEIDREWTCRM